jgi:carboxyl-terminal processing protease
MPRSTTLIVLIVAVLFVAGLAFGAGFLTRPLVLAAVQPASTATQPLPAATTEPPPATPVPATPTAPPTATPQPSVTPTEAPRPGLKSEFDRFWEAWTLVERDYFGELPSDAEVVNGAIKGALNALGDPFNAYIDAQAAAILNQNRTGSFGGIGAWVSMKEGQLVIVSIIENTPAEAAGLRSDDIVLEVDGTPIQNMSSDEAVLLIRGPEGTPVRLKIYRFGEEPFELELVRARIEIEMLESEMREDGIGYLRLTEFNTDAAAKLAEAIQSMQAQGAKGLILDLRSNPGGFLTEAVLTAGLFLPQGELVLIERFEDGSEQTRTTPEEPVAPEIPLVVLVDGASASASEIVAGALQDYGRAVLVGETTFGKGAVQWVETLSDGAELRVVAERWFTPKDRAIHGVGLEPDIAVEYTAEDAEAGADPQLDRAVQYLLTGE